MINEIRSHLLRRIALICYVPIFTAAALVLALLHWAHDVMLTTVDGIHAAAGECKDSVRLIRDVWRGPAAKAPSAECSCPPGFTCYERCGDI